MDETRKPTYDQLLVEVARIPSLEWYSNDRLVLATETSAVHAVNVSDTLPFVPVASLHCTPGFHLFAKIPITPNLSKIGIVTPLKILF